MLADIVFSAVAAEIQHNVHKRLLQQRSFVTLHHHDLVTNDIYIKGSSRLCSEVFGQLRRVISAIDSLDLDSAQALAVPPGRRRHRKLRCNGTTSSALCMPPWINGSPIPTLLELHEDTPATLSRPRRIRRESITETVRLNPQPASATSNIRVD